LLRCHCCERALPQHARGARSQKRRLSTAVRARASASSRFRRSSRQTSAVPGASRSQSATGLETSRVALRRLLAAISLFPDMLTDPQTEDLKSELKWITGKLGPAREFEVLLNARLPRRRRASRTDWQRDDASTPWR